MSTDHHDARPGDRLRRAREMAALAETLRWADHALTLLLDDAVREGVHVAELDAVFRRIGGPALDAWEGRLDRVVDDINGDEDARRRRKLDAARRAEGDRQEPGLPT